MQFKKKNSSHLRRGKAGCMNGSQWRRAAKQNGLHQQGAKPAALGWLEGWRCCSSPVPDPRATHLHPKLLSQCQPFAHFLSPKDGVIKQSFSRGRTRQAGGGEKPLPLLQAVTPSLSLGPNPRVCPAVYSWDTVGTGIPGGC